MSPRSVNCRARGHREKGPLNVEAEFIQRDAARVPGSKRAEQRALVEQACRELLSSEGWRRYAEVRATFHRYSFGNCMLIAMQRPDAVQVAGFRAWQSLGRQVRRGEHAIRILAPMAIKERDASGGETGESFTIFRAVPVFDIAQTDGDPLPQAPREPITGDSHARYVADTGGVRGLDRLRGRIRGAGARRRLLRSAHTPHRDLVGDQRRPMVASAYWCMSSRTRSGSATRSTGGKSQR